MLYEVLIVKLGNYMIGLFLDRFIEFMELN